MDFDFAEAIKEIDGSRPAKQFYIPATDTVSVPIIELGEGRGLKGVADLIQAHEKTQPQPYRRRGIYDAADVKSLLAWMSANTEESSPVFGVGAEMLGTNWKAPQLALLGIGNYAPKGGAAWHDFGARYNFPVAEAFKLWASKHGEWFEQAEFAEFIESRLYDLTSPLSDETLSEAVTRFLELIGSDAANNKVATPSRLFELSRGLALTATTKMEQKVNLQSGEATLVYAEEHSGAGGNPIKVPSMFYIRVPVFFGQPATLIGALLRYRAKGGTVKWSYELFAPDLIVKEQFEVACTAVKSAGRTFYLGTPDKP